MLYIILQFAFVHLVICPFILVHIDIELLHPTVQKYYGLQ